MSIATFSAFQGPIAAAAGRGEAAAGGGRARGDRAAPQVDDAERAPEGGARPRHRRPRGRRAG